jgi:hypothetical protein
MTKPDHLPCRPKPGSPPSRGALAFFVLLGERVKANPQFTVADLEKELAAVSDQLEAAKKEKK